jgi:hypothetical protein
MSLLPNGNMNRRTVIYNRRFIEHADPACGETDMPRPVNYQNTLNVMGDKSPKANQKKSSQKQAKASGVAANKKAAVAAKQAAGKKK